MLYSNQKATKKEIYNHFTGIYTSIKGGIIGFVIIAALIILTKLLSLSVSSAKNFTFDLNDFIISFWGFIILSFIVFTAENKSEKKT